MGWRKLSDNKQESRLAFDCVLSGVQALKNSHMEGQRLDRRSEVKHAMKGVWCSEVFGCVTPFLLSDNFFDIEMAHPATPLQVV